MTVLSKTQPWLSRFCSQGGVVAREDIPAKFFDRGGAYLVRIVDRDTGEIVAYVPKRDYDDPIADAVITAIVGEGE